MRLRKNIRILKALRAFIHHLLDPMTFLIWGLAIVDHWPKNNKNRVQIFAGGAVWVDVCEKLLMGHLTVLPNDEDMLLTDLSFKVRKKC